MAEKFTNLAKSTLASGITNGATSLTVATGDGNDLFPALSGSDFFRCVLFKKATGDTEIIKVTARSGDVFTITRAQEDIGNITATAFAFDPGDIIELRPTSAFYDSLGGVTTTQIQDQSYNFGADGGSVNAYSVTLSPSPASYASPLPILFLPNATNTGASTLEESSLGSPKPLKRMDGTNLNAGDIVVNEVAFCLYDATAGQFKLVNPRSNLGVSVLTWLSDLTGVVTRTLYDWLLDRPTSILDFMTTAERLDYRAGTLSVELTTAIQAAIDSGAKNLYAPRGKALVDTLVGASNVTLHTSQGCELHLKPHSTTHNPLFRMGDSSSAIENCWITGQGKIVGNSADQTGASDEWSHGVFIWGSKYCGVKGIEITDCRGDGVTIGYDSGRVVGSNGNKVIGIHAHANTRQQIAITYGNENKILFNRIDGIIDLELNASIGECKNNTVQGNTGVEQTENLPGPRISSLSISLASLNTIKERYSGNLIIGNHCKKINGQYNKGTIITANTIVGSDSTQTRLMDLTACDNTMVDGNHLIANTAVATSLTEIIRSRAGSHWNIVNNMVDNEAIPFHNYDGDYGTPPDDEDTSAYQNLKNNQLTGTGAYHAGSSQSASEHAVFRIDVAAGVKTITQIGGVKCTGNLVSSASSIILSGFGGSGTVTKVAVRNGCSVTTADASTLDAIALPKVVAAGSNRTISMYYWAWALGAMSVSEFDFSIGTGTFIVDVWF